MKTLTTAELDILRKIYAYTIENGIPPQNKHIVETTRNSKSTISEIVKSLAEKGAITKDKRNLLLNDISYKMLGDDLTKRLNQITDIIKDYGIKKVESNGKISVSEVTYKNFSLDSREDNFRYEKPKTVNKTNNVNKTIKKDTQKSKLRRILGW